jgi:hypothetical protein
MNQLPVLCSSSSRRSFLKACAGCGLACAAAPLAVAAPAEAAPKVKVQVVFTHPPRDVEGWPYVNFDYESKKKEILAKLGPACPYAEFTAASAESGDEAKRILESSPDVAGYLVFLLGIHSRGASQALVNSGKRVILVDHLYGGTGDFLGLYGAARRKGLPVAGVTSSRFEDVSAAVRALAAVEQMKSERILDVTRRNPEAMTKAIREAYGAEVVRVPGDELNALYDKVSEAEGKRWASLWTKGAVKVVEPKEDDILQGGRMYAAMLELLKTQKSRTITVDCLDLFYAKQLRAYPCLGFFQLNNDNWVGACEADLTSTSTMLLMSHLVGRPGYISDPVIDTSTNRIIYAHCVSTNKPFGPKGAANPYEIRSHSEDRKGAAVRSLMPLGQITTTLEFLPGQKQVVMHTARTVENIDEDKACRTKLAATVPDARKLAKDWSSGWHRVTYYGDHRTAVDTAAALLGFEVRLEG